MDGPPMWASAHVSRPPKRPSKMGFDEVRRDWGQEVGGGSRLSPPPSHPRPCLLQVFVISLARRPDRRERMLSSLWEMEIAGRVVDAVDGRWVRLPAWGQGPGQLGGQRGPSELPGGGKSGRCVE